jgi:hypothetical protein
VLLMFPCLTGSRAHSSQGREGRMHPFEHSLDGDARATWHPQDNPTHFWPAWLGSAAAELRLDDGEKRHDFGDSARASAVGRELVA